jgi:hypothetical protein
LRVEYRIGDQSNRLHLNIKQLWASDAQHRSHEHDSQLFFDIATLEFLLCSKNFGTLDQRTWNEQNLLSYSSREATERGRNQCRLYKATHAVKTTTKCTFLEQQVIFVETFNDSRGSGLTEWSSSAEKRVKAVECFQFDIRMMSKE